MYFRTPNRTLLRSFVAGAAVLAAAACSRSDRSGSAGDTTQVQSGAASSADTQAVASQPSTPSSTSSTQATTDTSTTPQHALTDTHKPAHPVSRSAGRQPTDTGVAGYQPMGNDTAAVGTGQAGQDTVAVGDSSHIGKTGDRLEPTAASEQANADTVADQSDSTRIRPPEDSTETVGAASADSGSAAAPVTDSTQGAPEMARDSTSSLAQADTAAPEQADTSTQVSADSSSVQVQVDTTQQTELAQQAPVDSAAPGQVQMDTAHAAADTAEAQAHADTTRIRPPEDSTELNGNVTDQSNESEVAVSDAEADTTAAGAAAVQTGNMATGADAVALVTREGRHCAVVTEDAERRDLASSPATLNPCGTGTMTLPRAQIEE